MGMNVGSLFASLTLQHEQFSTGLRTATREVQQTESAMARSMNSIAHVGKEAMHLLGIAMGAELAMQVAEGAHALLEYAGHLNVVAQQTGTTVEQYQILSRAAIQAGVSTETMDTALGRLQRSLGQAQGGNEQMIRSFERFGLTRPQIMALHDAGDAFVTLAQHGEHFATTQGEVAAGSAIMGRNFAQNLPLFREVGDGYDEIARQAEHAGLITAEQAHEAHEASVQLELLSWTIKNNLAIALADLLPYIEDIIAALGRIIGAARDAINAIAAIRVPSITGQGSTIGTIAGQGFRNAADATSRAILGPGITNLIEGSVNLGNARRAAAGVDIPITDHTGDLNPDFGGGHHGGRGHHARAAHVDDPLRSARDHLRTLMDETDALGLNAGEQARNNNLRQSGLATMDKFNAAVDAARRTGNAATLAHVTSLRDQALKLHDGIVAATDTHALEEYNHWLDETARTTEQAIRLDGLDESKREMAQFYIDISNERHRLGLDDGRNTADGSIEVGRLHLSEGEQALRDMHLGHVRATAATAQQTAATEKLSQALQDAQQHAEQMGQALAQIGTDMLDSLIFGTKSWQQTFSDAIMALGRLMVQELVTRPLQEMIIGWAQAMAKSGGGILGRLLGGLTGGVGGIDKIGSASNAGWDAFTFGKAEGGPVSGGGSYWVGERGPELFQPAVNGRIVPNSSFGGGGGMTFNIDARGSTNPAETQRLIHESIAQALPVITEAAHAKTMRRLSRPRMG